MTSDHEDWDPEDDPQDGGEDGYDGCMPLLAVALLVILMLLAGTGCVSSNRAEMEWARANSEFAQQNAMMMGLQFRSLMQEGGR